MTEYISLETKNKNKTVWYYLNTEKDDPNTP